MEGWEQKGDNLATAHTTTATAIPQRRSALMQGILREMGADSNPSSEDIWTARQRAREAIRADAGYAGTRWRISQRETRRRD